MKEISMSDFTKAAIIRLKTSIKGRTKTIENKEYREGFITGSRLVWDYMNTELSKYKAKYYNVVSKKKLYLINQEPKKTNIVSVFPEINHILEKVCKKLDVSIDEIKSPSRLKKFVYARTIAINIMLERASMNYSIVGNVLGKRNHTTIMYHHNQKNLKIGYWKHQNEIWNIYEEINKEL
jgi:chromosomal replication initiation ATPase DnaA